MLHKKVPDAITHPIVMGLVWVTILAIPLVSVLAYLNLHGLIRLYDLLIPGNFAANSGPHVAIASIFVELSTYQGILFHWSLFFWIGIFIHIVRYALKKSSVEFIVKHAYLFATVLVTGALFMVNIVAIGYFAANDRAISEALQADQSVRLATPTATHFLCPENAVLDIMPDGTVHEVRWEKSGNGTAHFSTIIGRINRETGRLIVVTEKYYTTDITDRIRKNLQECKNVDNKAVLDLYPEQSAEAE